jgi:hypothetical protein
MKIIIHVIVEINSIFSVGKAIRCKAKMIPIITQYNNYTCL